MNNLINKYETEQIEKLISKKRIPAFRSGDTIRVTIKIIEGERSRLQAFEGICIARKNNSLNSSFTIRKMSHGEGVERVFPLFSPIVSKIEVIKTGDVKRAKLYYLRKRTGKRARISVKDRGKEEDQYKLIDSNENDLEIKNVSEESKDKIDNEGLLKEQNEEVKSSKEHQSTASESPKVAEKNSDSSILEAEKLKDESKS